MMMLACPEIPVAAVFGMREEGQRVVVVGFNRGGLTGRWRVSARLRGMVVRLRILCQRDAREAEAHQQQAENIRGRLGERVAHRLAEPRFPLNYLSFWQSKAWPGRSSTLKDSKK
jgi:hypothetical protein